MRRESRCRGVRVSFAQWPKKASTRTGGLEENLEVKKQAPKISWGDTGPRIGRGLCSGSLRGPGPHGIGIQADVRVKGQGEAFRPVPHSERQSG